MSVFAVYDIKTIAIQCQCKTFCCNGNTVHPLKSTIYYFGNKYFTIINIGITVFQCNHGRNPFLFKECLGEWTFFFSLLHSLLPIPCQWASNFFFHLQRLGKLDILAQKQLSLRKYVELPKLTTQFKCSATTWQTHVFTATELHARFKD
jgi:hypothetical protein